MRREIKIGGKTIHLNDEEAKAFDVNGSLPGDFFSRQPQPKQEERVIIIKQPGETFPLNAAGELPLIAREVNFLREKIQFETGNDEINSLSLALDHVENNLLGENDTGMYGNHSRLVSQFPGDSRTEEELKKIVSCVQGAAKVVRRVALAKNLGALNNIDEALNEVK